MIVTWPSSKSLGLNSGQKAQLHSPFLSSGKNFSKNVFRKPFVCTSSLSEDMEAQSFIFNANLIFYSYSRLENPIFFFSYQAPSFSVWSHLFKFIKKEEKRNLTRDLRDSWVPVKIGKNWLWPVRTAKNLLELLRTCKNWHGEVRTAKKLWFLLVQLLEFQLL